MRHLLDTLPVYYDEEKGCYAYGDGDDKVTGSAFDCVSEFVTTSLFYPYSVDNEEMHYEGFVPHEHSFEDLIAAAIRYGKHFSIPEEYSDYYSEQELTFISVLMQSFEKEEGSTSSMREDLSES